MVGVVGVIDGVLEKHLRCISMSLVCMSVLAHMSMCSLCEDATAHFLVLHPGVHL